MAGNLIFIMSRWDKRWKYFWSMKSTENCCFFSLHGPFTAFFTAQCGLYVFYKKLLRFPRNNMLQSVSKRVINVSRLTYLSRIGFMLNNFAFSLWGKRTEGGIFIFQTLEHSKHSINKVFWLVLITEENRQSTRGSKLFSVSSNEECLLCSARQCNNSKITEALFTVVLKRR